MSKNALISPKISGHFSDLLRSAAGGRLDFIGLAFQERQAEDTHLSCQSHCSLSTKESLLQLNVYLGS